MTKYFMKILRIGLYVLLALTAALCAVLLAAPEARMDDGTALEPLHLSGEAALEGGAPLALTEGNLVLLRQVPSLRLRGHFTRDVPAGVILMLRLSDVRTVLCVNGETVLSFGQAGSYPKLARSPGDVWYSCVSPGIAAEDDIDILVEHVYTHTSVNAYEALLDHMYTGSPQRLLLHQLRENWLALLSGFITCSFGLLVLVAAALAACRRMPYVRQMLLFAGAALGAGLWMLFDFQYISLLIPYPVFNTTVAFLGLYAAPVFLLPYSRTFMTAWRRQTATLAGLVMLVLLGVAVVLQMCGRRDLAEFQIAATAARMVAVLLITVLLVLERRKKTNEQRTYLALLSFVPMLTGVLADALSCYFGHYRTTVGLDISFLFFAVMQAGILMRALQENARRSVQLEHDLLQSRVTLMLSQIKPHFLYNSLTAIKQLCATDPPAAETAVGYFANYLRSNLDALSSSTLIPLSREIAHTECYLKLEQMRFGERVRVVYDLHYQAFSLPSLTMQPLVENAVRYGITKKRDGGTITIFADETETEYIVRVSDDGVGFDPAQTKDDGDRSHIGLVNVRSRIEAMCEGTLEIDSAPGKGTTATIRIPKRDASGED